MARKLTEFIMFKNTPLVNFDKTIHFDTNEKRDDFFLRGNHYPTITYSQHFNFVSDRLNLRVSKSYFELEGVNYLTFISEFDNRRYYAFVSKTQYINDGTTMLTLVIDVMMTFTQGNQLSSFGQNVTIKRQHLTQSNYDKYKLKLLTNDDVLQVNTREYVSNIIYKFTEFMVVFTCSSDLSKDFGTVDAPKLETSTGQTYSGITSPVNLYVINQQQFNDLAKELRSVPWISQNIQSVLQIPTEFIDQNDLESVSMKSGFNHLKKFKNGAKSNNFDVSNQSITELLNEMGLTNKDSDIFRGAYASIEMLDWQGQKVVLDPAFLPDTGLKLHAQAVIGYANQVAIYPVAYKSRGEATGGATVARGTFLNNALIFKTFDDIPILIDNYTKNKAMTAYTRQLSEDKLISNRLSDMTNPKKSIQDKFFNAVDLLSPLGGIATGFATGGTAGGVAGVVGAGSQFFQKFSDEYEFYRTQKAQFADMSLTSPTITAQSTSNSLGTANDFFGVTLKYSVIDPVDIERVKKYHGTLGYQMDMVGDVDNVHSMSIVNYIEYTGNWKLDGVHTALQQQLHALIENGVQLWHDNGTANPFFGNILHNERII